MERSLFGSRKPRRVNFEGAIPGAPEYETRLLRTRVIGLVTEIAEKYSLGSFDLAIRYGSPDRSDAAPPANQPRYATDPPPGNRVPERPPSSGDTPPEFIAIEPNYGLEQVTLPASTLSRLLDCVSFVEVAPLVFDDWGLRAIEPHPSIAVNFRGPPGTGKTMAAHAAANYLKKKIMLSRLSDLESKYHGQGPKNLIGLFRSAAEQDAVLFIDEAESLLSRRFAQPEQAAESAINSMRTELLMALDSFDGLVIFASNLPHSYDEAIESRLLHVDFALPDKAGRLAIWRSHLPSSLPLDAGVSPERLADIEGVSGRDIKLAVISAAVGAARRKAEVITENVLSDALEFQRSARSVPEHGSGIDREDLARKVKARLERTQDQAGLDQSSAN